MIFFYVESDYRVMLNLEMTKLSNYVIIIEQTTLFMTL